jgi:hypothetical protein
MKAASSNNVAPPQGPPAPPPPVPSKAMRSIQVLGTFSFSALGFIFSGVLGCAVEGDRFGWLHFGAPSGLIAFVWARALMTRTAGPQA